MCVEQVSEHLSPILWMVPQPWPHAVQWKAQCEHAEHGLQAFGP